MTEHLSTPPGLHLPQSRYVLPSFVERTNYGIKESNPYNKLFEERIIFLGAPIDDVVANDVMAQLIVAGVQRPGPRHPDLHQLAGRLVHRADRDLRHDDVRPAGDPDDLHGSGRLGGCGAAGGRHEGQAVRTAELADPDPPALRARARGRSPTWRSRPTRSCGCAACWRRSWPGTPGRPTRQVRADIERDTILTAEQAKEYGIVDEVITTRKLDRLAGGWRCPATSKRLAAAPGGTPVAATHQS